MKTTVLVIEQEDKICQLLAGFLRTKNITSLLADDGQTGLGMACAETPSLIVIDTQVPGLSGLEVCKALKSSATTSSIPVLLMSADGEEDQEIACLEAGADDYIRKPFDLSVFHAHVLALLRRGPYLTPRTGVLQKGGIQLDRPKKQVVFNGKTFGDFTPKEFDLLYHLVCQDGEPTTRETLYQQVWQTTAVDKSMLRTVDVHVRRLRAKLKLNRETGIVSVSGRGYKWSN